MASDITRESGTQTPASKRVVGEGANCAGGLDKDAVMAFMEDFPCGLFEWGAEPGLEPRLAESRRRGERHQGLIAELSAEIARMDVARDLTRVTPCAKYAAHQFIEAKFLRAGDFQRAVDR